MTPSNNEPPRFSLALVAACILVILAVLAETAALIPNEKGASMVIVAFILVLAASALIRRR